MDVLTGDNLLSILVATKFLIYQPVRSSSRKGGKWGKGVDTVILAISEYHFIRGHGNLVQNPSIIISIVFPPNLIVKYYSSFPL